MPWVKLYDQPLSTGIKPTAPVEEDLRPTHAEIWQAAWRQENTAGSFFSDKTRNSDLDTVDPNFSAWELAKGTKYENYPDQLGRLRNRPAYDAWKTQIDMEEKDQQILDAAGFEGTVAKVVAGVVDFPTLIPADKIFQGGKAGLSVGKWVVSKALGGGLKAGIQEEGLQATQATRSGEKSAGAVAGGAVGGVAMGKVKENPEVQAAWQAFKDAIWKNSPSSN